MSEVRWVIQTNLGSAEDRARLIQSVKNYHKAELVECVIRPFTEELPDCPTDKPAIFSGSVTFVDRAWRTNRWSPCAFFNDNNFRFEEWRYQYYNHVLNQYAIVMSINQFSKSIFLRDRLFFIRPVKDLKEFAGTVIEFGKFQEWRDNLIGTELSPDTLIVVAEPKYIEHEWRVFIVDGKAITGSHYRADRRLMVEAGLPQEVIDFTSRLCKWWVPAPVFVMDVGYDGSELKMIEINSFNCSGFYKSDTDTIVKEVTNYTLRS